MTTSHERIGDTLVFRAGPGEWFNQPGNYRWDMGEDAEDRPPSRWHLDLQGAIRKQQSSPRVVVVDLTSMAWVVGVDLGFLIDLSKVLSPNDAKLAVVANKNVREAVSIAKLSPFFDVVSSVNEAL